MAMLHVADQRVPLTPDANDVLYVTGSRVSLHSIVGLYNAGASAEEIVREYESLALPDVFAIFAFYLNHKDAVDAQLAEEERRSEHAAADYRDRLPKGLSEKLKRARRGC